MTPWNDVGLNEEQWKDIDAGYRKALLFYIENRAAMDEGVEMLDAKALPVHLFYWKWAGVGEAAVMSELQQHPMQDEGIEEKKLDYEYILKRRTLTPAFIVPKWCKYVFVTTDIQMHCLWVEATAANAELDTCQVIEYGKVDTGMNKDGAFAAIPSDKEKALRVDQVIFEALMKVHQRVSQGWQQEGTREIIYPSLCGTDCGGTTPLSKFAAHAWYQTVLDFCTPKNSGGKWVALKGEKWSKSAAEDALEAGASNWLCRKDSGGRHDANADYYKTLDYNALNVGAGEWKAAGAPPRGSKYLHADEGFRIDDDGVTRIYSDAKAYAKQQAAEKFVAEIKTGVNVENSERIGWQPVGSGRANHGKDTGWMNFALRDIFRYRQGRQNSYEKAVKAAQSLPAAKGPQLPSFVQRERF